MTADIIVFGEEGGFTATHGDATVHIESPQVSIDMTSFVPAGRRTVFETTATMTRPDAVESDDSD